ncbi:MAG: Foldase protein PrsA 1 precursor [bacterium ADurb.Bin212]|nr:MAG: Foldase protein PrsA 1 precursor [bacterium ADurb.Bin212]
MKKVVSRLKGLAQTLKKPNLIKKSNAKNSTKKTSKQTSRRGLSFLAIVIILIFLVEFSFALSIYAFKSTDNITKSVAKAIPYPAVFAASGVSTVNDFWAEKEYIEHFYNSTKQTDYSEEDLVKQILKQEAENVIIKKEAITYKKSVSKEEIEESMAQIYEGNGGEEEVEKALQDLYGLSVDEFKNLVEIQLLRDKINKEVIARVVARHILIRVEEGASEEVVNEAKTRITGYLTEIKNGLSFDEAANKYSEDVGSNQNGGLLESFARGDMVEEFEKVAFSSAIGDISEPFQTSFGWHILKVEEKTGYVEESFDNWIDELMAKNMVIYLFKG